MQPFTVERQDTGASLATFDGNGNLTIAGNVYAGGTAPTPGAPVTGAAGTLMRVATTGPSGYTLVNGTGTTIMSWTTPNDGQLHRMVIESSILVATTETGGLIQVTWRGPGATSDQTSQLFAAGLAGGTASQAPSTSGSWVIAPGTTVSVKQATALTLGAAVMYAEIWGS